MTEIANRPPRDIDPARFFTEWLPREFALEFGPGRRSASNITVAVELDGEDGGHWVLDVHNNSIRARGPLDPGAPPEVSMRQTVADWRALAAGEEGPIDLAPPQASPLDVLFVDPASRQVMASVKGTVRFEVSGFNGRTWSLQVKFGTQPWADRPDATMTVDAETYAAVLAKKLAPPEAYFSGRIQLKGNTALAMQLAMAMLPRFTG